MSNERPAFANILNFAGRKHALVLAPDLEPRQLDSVLLSMSLLSRAGYSSIEAVIPSERHAAVRGAVPSATLRPNWQLDLEESICAIARAYDPRVDALTLCVHGHGKLDGSKNAYLEMRASHAYAHDVAARIEERLGSPSLLVIADICYGSDFALEFISGSHTSAVAACARRTKAYGRDGSDPCGSTFAERFFPALEIHGDVQEAFNSVQPLYGNSPVQQWQYLQATGDEISIRPSAVRILLRPK